MASQGRAGCVTASVLCRSRERPRRVGRALRLGVGDRSVRWPVAKSARTSSAAGRVRIPVAKFPIVMRSGVILMPVAKSPRTPASDPEPLTPAAKSPCNHKPGRSLMRESRPPLAASSYSRTSIMPPFQRFISVTPCCKDLIAAAGARTRWSRAIDCGVSDKTPVFRATFPGPMTFCSKSPTTRGVRLRSPGSSTNVSSCEDAR